VKKKGQAAMEFLMTYGWAILAAVIVVGVLWFLLGDPQGQVGDRVDLAAPLFGNAVVFTAGDPGHIDLEIKNNGAEDITLGDIVISDCAAAFDASATSISRGATEVVAIDCDTAVFTSGDTIQETISVEYTKSSSTLTQTSSGSIAGRVP